MSLGWHLLTDAIDFQQSLAFDLEIGPGEPALLENYRSITWAYLQ
jgi:hypothetical protein